MPRKKEGRAAQGSGNIRKRSDGRWEARYTVGRDPGTGKQVRRSVYGATQGEVRKKLQAICVSIDDGIYTEPAKISFGTWLDIWLEEYTEGIKPLTKASYRRQIKNHIKPALGVVKLSTLNAPEIQSMYNRLHKAEKPLSAKTIQNLHGVVHKALQQAVEIGYIKFNPSDACKLPRIEKKEIKPLDEQEIALFLKAIQGHSFERIYLVDVFTGMRQGEILGLSWDCIDFEKGTVFIYRQLEKVEGVYQFGSLKNGKTRRITPAPSVMKVLLEQRRVQNEWRLKAGEVWDNPDNLVFTNEIGGHLAHVTVYKNFKRIVKSLGLEETRFHDLRHTYAVASLASGDDVKTVQENLGHQTAAFTLNVYGHVTDRMKEKSAQRMENFIEGVKNL